MIFYVLQVLILLGVFISIYQLILSNKTMFKFNRYFLMITLLGSILIPLIPFETIYFSLFSRPINPLINVIKLDELVIKLDSKNLTSGYDLYHFIKIVLIIGSTFFMIRFVKELFYIIQLKRDSEKTSYQGIRIYKMDKRNEVFSFGKVLFIDSELFKQIDQINEIWIHEKAHIQQNHTIDRLIIEFCKIFFWFIPFIYQYSKCMKMNHEYLADEEVIKNTNNIKNYQNQLLDYMLTKHNLLVSTFNFKLTKKRFIMMKNKTKLPIQIITKMNVMLVVIFVFTLIACTKKDENNISETDVENTNGNLEKEHKLVDKKASPIKGINNFYSDFVNEFNVPESSFSSNDTLLKVTLNFVVEKDGSITDIKVANNVEKVVADEAIRVLKLMPKWNPAIENGKDVASNFYIPITIVYK